MDELSIGILVALMLLGLVLLLVEFFLIPGTTFVGLIGGLLMIVAVVLAFTSKGTTIGLYFLVAAFLISAITGYTGLKVYSSDKLSMNKSIDSRNYLQSEEVEPGSEGVAITDLRPNGKAKFGKVKFEVYSQGEYIDSGTPVEAVEVYDHKIYVKSKTS